MIKINFDQNEGKRLPFSKVQQNVLPKKVIYKKFNYLQQA